MEDEHILMELSNYYHTTSLTHTLKVLNPYTESAESWSRDHAVPQEFK